MSKEKKLIKKKKKTERKPHIISQSLISTTWYNNEVSDLLKMPQE